MPPKDAKPERIKAGFQVYQPGRSKRPGQPSGIILTRALLCCLIGVARIGLSRAGSFLSQQPIASTGFPC